MSRRSGALDVTVALALLMSLGAIAMLMRGATLSGEVRVVDGDSLELDTTRIRLKGIDAPELGQTCERGGSTYRCGEVARDALREMARSGPVSCRTAGLDRYGRSLAVCAVAGHDLGAALVGRGLAVSYGGYETEEREARSRHLGLWAGTFERPSEWRKQHGHHATAQDGVRPHTP